VPGQGEELPARLGALPTRFPRFWASPKARPDRAGSLPPPTPWRQINNLATAYREQRQNAMARLVPICGH